VISLWLSGSVVALLGCGGDQHYGDCRDAAKSCDTPFVCQLDDEAQSEEWTCSSPKEFVQTCSTSPSQLPAFAMSSDGSSNELRWHIPFPIRGDHWPRLPAISAV